jgi:hypothetical protein
VTFFLTAILCFAGSTLYHLFFPQSITAVYWLGILDFTGNSPSLHFNVIPMTRQLTNELPTDARTDRHRGVGVGQLLPAGVLRLLLLPVLAAIVHFVDLSPGHCHLDRALVPLFPFPEVIVRAPPP